MRVLVIGSGLGGLAAALTAVERRYEVTVVTKAGISEANTAWAQGGIAVARGANDSPSLHASDTMRAGAGAGDPRAIEVLTQEGAAVLDWLQALGARFDCDADGQLARGLEAAHSVPRVYHAGGDATGAEIERALVSAIRTTAIAVVEHTALTDLVVRDGRVVGIDTVDADGSARRWLADAVVLATGGAGQLYRHTTNPTVATGDGVAAAIRAGAQVADLEWYQFHPTALAVPEPSLVSEAVRGEGAVLRNREGERFLLAVHPDAELAPRDVVARAVAGEALLQFFCGESARVVLGHARIGVAGPGMIAQGRLEISVVPARAGTTDGEIQRSIRLPSASNAMPIAWRKACLTSSGWPYWKA